MLAGRALAPSNISLVMNKTRTHNAIRTIDYDVKRSQSFAIDASLTDLG